MSILINGMEMPKGCYECALRHRAFNGEETVHYCYAICKEVSDDGEIDADCPLVLVQPHGRLIDADALHELFEYQWHHLQVLNWNGNPTAKARQSGINWCISTMRDSAPTIIPAEEGE